MAMKHLAEKRGNQGCSFWFDGGGNWHGQHMSMYATVLPNLAGFIDERADVLHSWKI